VTAKAFLEAVREAGSIPYDEFCKRLGVGMENRRAENLFFVARDLAKVAGEFQEGELASVLGLES
jgi:hypothetical protein